MNRLVSSAAIAAFTLLASVPALPAYAAPVTLTVADIDPLPGQTVAVSGDGDDCPADAAGAAGTFTVTLSYTTPAEATATVVSSGAVAADGTFTSSVTVPENAAADSPANIIAAATCSGVTTASNRVTLAVLYHAGVLTMSAPSVQAGETITATGTNCYGGEYVIVYGTTGGDPNTYTQGTSGTPAADRTFAATLTIPAAQTVGRYDVYALCPGTEFDERTITISAGDAPTVEVPDEPAEPTTSTVTVAASAAPRPIGGGFTGGGSSTGGGTTTGGGTDTPVATAPVAVQAEASFTG